MTRFLLDFVSFLLTFFFGSCLAGGVFGDSGFVHLDICLLLVIFFILCFSEVLVFTFMCPRSIVGVPLRWELHSHPITAHHSYVFSTSREG